MQETAMSWTDLEIQSAWDKGEIVEKFNPHKWRKDSCGAWISRDQHGNRESRYGWEIEPITPATQGGSNDLSNLRPLQWKNAASRKDGKLSCPIRAHGGDNFDFG
jgi:hypothetical protein